jgi:hypothetical protein
MLKIIVRLSGLSIILVSQDVGNSIIFFSKIEFTSVHWNQIYHLFQIHKLYIVQMSNLGNQLMFYGDKFFSFN